MGKNTKSKHLLFMYKVTIKHSNNWININNGSFSSHSLKDDSLQDINDLNMEKFNIFKLYGKGGNNIIYNLIIYIYIYIYI